MSPDGLTVEIRFKSEELRRGFAHRLLKKLNHRDHLPVHAGSTWYIPIQCGDCRRRYGVVPVGPGIQWRLQDLTLGGRGLLSTGGGGWGRKSLKVLTVKV